MLKNVNNISRDPPANTNGSESIVPDPWQDPDTDPTTPPLPATWQLPLDFHRSIAPAGNPNALQLPPPTLSSLGVLLQDWLKLGIENETSLAERLQEAIALLYLSNK